MAKYILPQLDILTETLSKLPSVGRRSASRLAFHLITMSQSQVDNFIDTIVKTREKIHECPICGNFTQDEICSICANPHRDHSLLCIVEDARSVMAFERMGDYNGVYHILQGNVGPDGPEDKVEKMVDKLLAHLEKENIKEVIMATNPSVEGEATSMFLSKFLKGHNIKCSRIAYGLPVGADLDCTDEMTLARAFLGRSTFGE